MGAPSETGAEGGATVSGGETVGDVAYARIRADILFGQRAPGERLRLDEASRRYGVSVGTMRELLNRLASEGLVVAEAQRGFEVAPASAAEFREIAALRQLLEGHALALSFATGDLDWEARVVAAHHKLAVTEHRMLTRTDSDPTLVRQCDRAFHQALTSACGSRVLLETLGSIHDRYLRYLSLAAIFRGEQSIQEHADLLACALARDAERATRILKVHIDSCLDYALADGPPAWASGPAVPDHAPSARDVAARTKSVRATRRR
ncbi:GntR family transcriptional regulator [Methylobacterium currus]|uniref:GntR family transcriptional regulator n=1 Tax=Methylobacterium currus TaxID=2051553 RepID=A0A2R4WQH0_9HYPH|nr:GntR family transcriptional regulator [Methylobacterium currus]AWB23796.1 GntR family transcriptional regulator [Methylobacterium currus]UHC16531.1 GntR family transcriptional regulator [Methylobacterium currus]